MQRLDADVILSVVLPIASAAEIEWSISAPRPPTVAAPISAPPSVRIPARNSSAWRPRPFSPPDARSPALSMRFRLCSPLWPTETSSALTCPPPSTARRMAYVFVRRAIVQPAYRDLVLARAGAVSGLGIRIRRPVSRLLRTYGRPTCTVKTSHGAGLDVAARVLADG